MTGKVFTFYSFKGGVGRSMCLAHVAWILASNDKKVLVVDWDLESPGLHRYFQPVLESSADFRLAQVGGTARSPTATICRSPGLLEIMTEFYPFTRDRANFEIIRKGRYLGGSEERLQIQEIEEKRQRAANDILRDLVRRYYAMNTKRIFHSTRELLHILPAGNESDVDSDDRRIDPYSRRLASLEWGTFYNNGGLSFLRKMISELRHEFDYILIDSRTGYSGTAEACLSDFPHFPDAVVFCFALNNQSIDGTYLRAEQLRAARQDIAILPVPTRVDASNNARVNDARSYYHTKFADIVRNSKLVPACETERYLENVEIRYAPSLAFNENLPQLPIASAGTAEPVQSVTTVCARIAGYLTSIQDIGIRIADHAEWSRLSKRTAFPRLKFSDVIVSFVYRDQSWADWIMWQLERNGFRVSRHPASLPETESLDDVWGIAEGKVCLLTVMSPEYDRSESGRLAWQWFDQKQNRFMPTAALLPVLVTRYQPNGIFANRSPLELIVNDESDARQSLLEAVGVPDGQRTIYLSSRLCPPFPGVAHGVGLSDHGGDSRDLADLVEHTYNEGRYHLNTGDDSNLDQAFDQLSVSENAAGNMGYGSAQARALLGMALARIRQKRWASAAKILRSANDRISIIILDDELATRIREIDGMATEAMGDRPPRLDPRRPTSDLDRAWAELEIIRATTDRHSGRMNQARQHATTARILVRDDPAAQARCNLALGLVSLREENLSRAADQLGRAHRLAREDTDAVTRFAALLALADTTPDGTAKENYYLQAMEAANDVDLLMITYFKLGDLKIQQGDRDKAREHFQRAVAAVGDRILISTYLLRAYLWTRPALPELPTPTTWFRRLNGTDQAAIGRYIDHALVIISISRILRRVEAGEERTRLAAILGDGNEARAIFEERLVARGLPNEQDVRQFVSQIQR
ncbi:TIR domain-containing protein [Frankia sp. CiP3]|uniref:TIR domain-containing protein n=1 Tax=Frankia sp. CiP3 TaxID=2880971 RepID=UPI001EF71E2D|nr:TIR domain-containing protein [Frankia sp. CiP3]